MQLGRRSFVAGLGASTLAACAPRTAALRPAPPLPAPGAPSLIPLAADRFHLMKVTVCTRPFRPAGPRIEVERHGDKTVVHNYGHGGSGWSLSWGCAQEAVALARSAGGNEYAVIGAGVIGLTTALTLVETGAKVTIYADEFPAETRSARATGVWSPGSRIALAGAAPTEFAARWESWARRSFAVHRGMVGLAGHPVEYLPEYGVGGEAGLAPPASPSPINVPEDFLSLWRTVRDLQPPRRLLEGNDNPFPAREVSVGQTMTFNVASYTDRLARLFLLRGGKMIRRSFPDRTAALSLAEPVVLNCMGFGAKAIWDDASLVPVRGQINWLMPQDDARYAIHHDGVFAVSRRDGVIVQYTGGGDGYGYGIENEDVLPAETAFALGTLRSLFANRG